MLGYDMKRNEASTVQLECTESIEGTEGEGGIFFLAVNLIIESKHSIVLYRVSINSKLAVVAAEFQVRISRTEKLPFDLKANYT